MRTLKKYLMTFGMIAGLALAVSAQKDDKKPPPQKPTPPVVTPQPKPPDPNKPKKPGSHEVYIKAPGYGESE